MCWFISVAALLYCYWRQYVSAALDSAVTGVKVVDPRSITAVST